MSWDEIMIFSTLLKARFIVGLSLLGLVDVGGP